MTKLFDVFPEVKNDQELGLLQAKFKKYDPSYLAQAAGTPRRESREWMEKLWKQYEPYADTKFPVHLKTQFSERAWELYLGAAFLNHGYKLMKHHDDEPDLNLFDPNNSQQCWIEGVSTKPGDGDDKVPDMLMRAVMSIPEDQMLFRITNSFHYKFLQYEKRILNAKVQKNEPYVIAINRSDLGYSDLSLPLIFKVLFGIGHMIIQMPINSPSDYIPEFSWSRRSSISKRNGEPVSMTFFNDENYSAISAVIYCSDHIISSPRLFSELGENFVIIHNPLAVNRLETDFFSFGQEYRLVDGEIKVIRQKKEWQKPDIGF